VNETSEEDNGQGRAIILQKDAKRVPKETAATDFTADICDHEDEQSCDDGQVEFLSSAKVLEDLDSFLEVDEGDVETEDVAGEACNPSKPVARVCYGEDPMKDE
jgi:hypothetical protein